MKLPYSHYMHIGQDFVGYVISCLVLSCYHHDAASQRTSNSLRLIISGQDPILLSQGLADLSESLRVTMAVQRDCMACMHACIQLPYLNIYFAGQKPTEQTPASRGRARLKEFAYTVQQSHVP